MSEDKERAGEAATSTGRAAEPLTSRESLAGRRQSKAVEESIAAFSMFYRSQTPRLVTFLVAQGAPMAVAAELTQEVMTDLWRHWDSVESPKSWARTAGVRSWIRYRTRVPELPMDIAPDSPLLRPPDPEATEEIHLRHDLLLLLARLPDRQRQVMASVYDDARPAEIAAELAITEATVRATIRDARKTLNRYRGKDTR